MKENIPCLEESLHNMNLNGNVVKEAADKFQNVVSLCM